MGRAPKKERNDRIVKIYHSNDVLLKELGDKFDITRERVRQILQKRGVDTSNNRLEKELSGHNKTSVIKCIEKFIRSNNVVPTRDQWDQFVIDYNQDKSDAETIPSYNAINKKFTDWTTIRREAAAGSHTTCRCKEVLERQRKLISELKKLKHKLGRPPTYTEIKNSSITSHWYSYIYTFGRISELYQSLGWPLHSGHGRGEKAFQYKNYDIMEELMRIYNERGKGMDKKDFDDGAEISKSTINRRMNGCKFSIITLADNYKDSWKEIDWSDSDVFSYHFNGRPKLNNDRYSEFLSEQ